jgi:peroxiredoxin
MKPGQLINLVLVIALLGAGFWWLLPDERPMPDVTFTLTDGTRIDSQSLRGKRVLINFWSVSCTVCLRDMPRLKALHESLAEQQFIVIGVAMHYDPPPAVVAIVKDLAPGYPVALDVQGELASAFGDVSVTPTSFLIDRSGNIRQVTRGALDENRVRATLLTL